MPYVPVRGRELISRVAAGPAAREDGAGAAAAVRGAVRGVLRGPPAAARQRADLLGPRRRAAEGAARLVRRLEVLR